MHKKIFTMLVGLSGLCAILFISIHLIVNSLVVFDSINASGGIVYNQVNHFIYSNPFAKTFESLIAIGFLCHIFMASVHALQKLKKEGLYLSEVCVDGGRTIKWGRAGSKGRHNPLLKRSSKIVVGLSERKQAYGRYRLAV